MVIKWLLSLLMIMAVEARSQDPFHQRPKAGVKVAHVLKKCRYHGFLKVNGQVFGILKMVGAEYELLTLGLHKGLGKVMIIETSHICIHKSGKTYCLNRSDMPKAWELMHV